MKRQLLFRRFKPTKSVDVSVLKLCRRIRRKDIMVWDVELQKWRLPKTGKVTFHVGASSRNLPLVSYPLPNCQNLI